MVLICGLALAILVAILEFCWNSKKNAQADRQSLCSEMAEELRFALRCHGSRQRPALKRNCIKCTPGTTYVPGMSHHLNGVSIYIQHQHTQNTRMQYINRLSILISNLAHVRIYHFKVLTVLWIQLVMHRCAQQLRRNKLQIQVPSIRFSIK